MAKRANLVRPAFVMLGCTDKAVAAVGNSNDYTPMIFGMAAVFIRLSAEQIGWQAREALGDENYTRFLRMILDGVVSEQGIDPLVSPDWNKGVGLLVLGNQFEPDHVPTKNLLKALFPKARCFKASSYGDMEEVWKPQSRRRKPAADPVTPPLNPMFNFPIEELPLGVRPYNVLKRFGIETVGDLVAKPESYIRSLPNMGYRSVQEVLEVLKQHGLKLADEPS